MGNIQRLQEGLKKLWTDELYSDQFKESPSKYKDFDHALKHLRKAAQELENMTEEADHTGASDFDKAAITKYVADLMICAIRLANVDPTGSFNVEEAVFKRIERKMGAVLERESDGEEKRLKDKIAQLREALWGQVRQWNDPSDRNFMLCGLCGTHEFEKHKPSCVLAK